MYKYWWGDWENTRLEIMQEIANRDEGYYEDKFHVEQIRANKLKQENKELQAKFDILYKMSVESADKLNAIKSSKAYKVLKWVENLFSYRIRLIKTDNLK